MKRIISIILVLCITCSMLPYNVFASEKMTEPQDAIQLFSDVNSDNVWYDSIMKAYVLNLMKGVGPGKFNYSGNLTHAEAITIAARIHMHSNNIVDDLSQTTPWYANYVDYAVDNGIITNVNIDLLSPVTMLDLAHYFYSSLDSEDLKPIEEFNYGSILGAPNDPAVYSLYSAGVLAGNYFDAEGGIIRGMAADVSVKMVNASFRTTEPVDDTPPPTRVDTSDNEVSKDEDASDDKSDNYDENNGIKEPFDIVYDDTFNGEDFPYSDDCILVKVPSSFSGKVSADLAEIGVSGFEKSFDLGEFAWYIAYISEGFAVEDVMAELRKLDVIKVAEYNYIYESKSISDNEALLGGVIGNVSVKYQWHVNACGVQSAWKTLMDYNLPEAGAGTVVAVIDTGVDYTHEDLKSNMWYNAEEISDNGIDDDGNGYVDDYYGVDFVNGIGSGNDDHGHGTHVAGIIAAANNNVGTVGIAYNSKIMALKAGDASGNFQNSDIAAAIIYAYENGADVINMSFGGSTPSIAVQDALATAYSRCVLVASAGNDGADNESTPTYPAALKYVIGVMSVNKDGIESSYTNYDVVECNSFEYEVYAPGEEILSTIPGNKYATWNGTSMAAPFVSATAAILRSIATDRETYDTNYIYGQIVGTGDTTPTCYDPEEHGGHNIPAIVNVYDALTKSPVPDLKFVGYTIFDTEGLNGNTKNNGDGVIDAGETIALGLTVRNIWGISKDTLVTIDSLSAAGMTNPYITIDGRDKSTKNYGDIDSYSEADSGKIIENGAHVGWRDPFYIDVSADTPNDASIKLNVTMSGNNGLDETDTEVYTSEKYTIELEIRRGVLLPNYITEDLTVTADNYYIIPGSMTVEAGATLTIEEGTQIQFWSNDPQDAYADHSIVYLEVRGNLIANGTADNHISLFPSDLKDEYRVEIKKSGEGYVELNYCDVVNPYLDVTKAYGCYFTQNYGEPLRYRYYSAGNVYESFDKTAILIENAELCSFYAIGNSTENNYKAVLNANCKQCVFADSAISYLEGYVYEDCLFLGNNTYRENETVGQISSMKQIAAIDLRSIDVIAINGTTGKTYAFVQLGEVSNLSITYLNNLLSNFGGHLACFDEPEEVSFINSYLPTPNSDFIVGLKRAGFKKYEWVNGASFEAPDFFYDKTSDVDYGFALSGGFTYSFEDYNNSKILIELNGGQCVDSIGLTEREITLEKDAEYKITLKPAPASVDVSKFIFESSDDSVATVTESGLITAIAEGTAEIKVSTQDRAYYSILKVTVCAKEIPVWDGTVADGFASGTGTEDDPYIIETAEQLAYFAGQVNNGESYSGKYIRLANDIYLNDETFEKNAETGEITDLNSDSLNAWTPIESFSGTFDGDGHEIHGLYINSEDNDLDVGLFGYISGSTIKNVGIVESYVKGNSTVASIAAFAVNSYVTYCYNTSNIFGGDRSNVGGIVGQIDYGVYIANCYNTGDIYSENTMVGGIVGGTTGSSGIIGIENCYNTGSVTGNIAVGGIIGMGQPSYCPINNCYNVGDIYSDNHKVGAIDGYNDSYDNMTNCYYLEGCVKTESSYTNGTPLTEEAMRLAESYVGFDFDNVWVMDPEFAYPQLREYIEIPSDENEEEVPVWDGTIADGFASGSGTEDDPYIIETAEQLAYFAGQVNNGESYSGKCIDLAGDIYLNDETFVKDAETGEIDDLNSDSLNVWTPIGASSETPFNGVFRGNEHIVSGVYVNNTDSCAGLFGHVSGDARIRYLGVVDSYVKGTTAGGIVAYITSTAIITGCHNNGIVIGTNNVGGVVGYFAANWIMCSYNTGDVSGTSNVGGVIGYCNSGNVDRCFNNENVTGIVTSETDGSRIGGIIGSNETGSVENCYNTGTISGKSDIGGIVGYNVSGTIRYCYNIGDVTGISNESGSYESGGIVGCNKQGEINNCNNFGTITGYSYIGGIAGTNDSTDEGTGGFVYGCFNNGIVSGNTYVGAVIGANFFNVENCRYLYDTATDESGTIQFGIGCMNSGEFAEDVDYMTWGYCEGDMSLDYFFMSFDFGSTWFMDPEYDYPQLSFTLDTSSGVTNKEPDYIWNGDASGDFASGSGTEDDPYIIETAEQLARLANNVSWLNMTYSGEYIKLANDIYLNNETFTFDPDTGLVKVTDGVNVAYFGTGVCGDGSGNNTVFDNIPSEPGFTYMSDTDLDYLGEYGGILNWWHPIGCEDFGYFEGNFDGDGHVISGLYSNSLHGYRTAGLFGFSRGNISNLGIVSSYVNGTEYIGAIVANAHGGKIINCYNEGVITGSAAKGGICGTLTETTVENCYNIGMVFGSDSGGIAGSVFQSTISHCYNIGEIISYYVAGGIGAYVNDGTISHCYNVGNISGKYNYIGGIAGRADSGMIEYCYNSGTVTASSYCGGIIGMAMLPVEYCYNVGSVRGGFYVGAISGDGYNITLENCYYLSGSATNLGGVIQNACGDQELGETYDDPSSGVMPLTKEQMKSVESFRAFDFESIWIIDTESEYPYPQFIGLDHLDPKLSYAETVRDENYEDTRWTSAKLMSDVKNFFMTEPSLFFLGNAIINRYLDSKTDAWFKIEANEVPNYFPFSLAGNYWGTTNELLIEKQIFDFDDYQKLADIKYDGYLTKAGENVWPHVSNITILNENGEAVSTIGKETVTFRVEFNRDMNTDIDLILRFGSAYPYADYEVSGKFVDARTWEGTVTLKTIIGGGIQYISVDNAESADGLAMFRDWGRYSFTIDATTALSMNLQGECTDDGVLLSWVQDDYDTLAGYNVYRSTEEDGFYQRLNKTIIPAGEGTYLDTDVEPGVLYYYNFTVVLTDLSESEPSGKIELMTRDTMSPTMYHTPVYRAFTGKNLVVSALITDNVSVQYARLYFRVAGTDEWSYVSMSPLNDKYSAVIASSYVTLDGIEYYIEAFDGNTYSYKGSADDPYLVTVQVSVSESDLGDVDGDGKITNRDALMLLQAVNDRLNLTAEQFERADINDDGILVAAEALRILQYVSGKITDVKF